MPYIDQETRDDLETGLPIENVGNLTYLLTKTLHRYWIHSPKRYQNIAEILGALECAKADFWENVASVYEKKKREENGGIW